MDRSTVAPPRNRLVHRLPALREELERQRDFRTEQLAQLRTREEPHPVDAGSTRAMREVRAVVAAGAEQALADIELALTRMRDGTYGRCRRCDADIGLAVLTAIPKATACLACQRLLPGNAQSSGMMIS